VTKIVSDLRLAYSTNKTDRRDIAKILVKVALNSITLTQATSFLTEKIIIDFIYQM
jgi:hypothetical protein